MQEASASSENQASLSPESAKEGMQWLASWVSSQYMGMVGLACTGKSFSFLSLTVFHQRVNNVSGWAQAQAGCVSESLRHLHV